MPAGGSLGLATGGLMRSMVPIMGEAEQRGKAADEGRLEQGERKCRLRPASHWAPRHHPCGFWTITTWAGMGAGNPAAARASRMVRLPSK